ncbi:MAG: glycosyltransferase family 2 protein [Syntrophales bacterium]|jgi:GT2 family glycosyltransferase|nr:glycosyltransferase family 2 protein [Syntrophales bacterium]MDX9922909.1 glycosyltransferase family 2 protein [Syntrophales bacterium]
MPNVSAIIVNYNAGNMLKDNVRALLRSKIVAEVLVIDNASDDDSVDSLKRLNASSKRLKVIRNTENEGFAGACNIGLGAASGEYLLFVNPDCRVEPASLMVLRSCLERTPRAGMAGPLLLNPDGTEQAGGRRAVPTPWRSFVRAFGLSRLRNRYPKLFSDFILNQEPLPEKPVEVEAISGSCMLVKRTALADVGPWDEGYFLHCEDLDWCMRFRRNGWQVVFVPDAPVVHCQGTCSTGRPIFVEWHKHRGMMRFYGKFFRHQYPGILFWIVGIGVWTRFAAVSLRHGVKSLFLTGRR